LSYTKKILIATDGSDLSAKAVESGLRLSGAGVIAVKIVRRCLRSHMDGACPKGSGRHPSARVGAEAGHSHRGSALRPHRREHHQRGQAPRLRPDRDDPARTQRPETLAAR